MEFDEIIERILLIRNNLTREEVLRIIEEKKKASKGYYTNEGAARVVASEFGVEISRKPFRSDVLVRNLVSGLNNVTLTGRIIMIYPLKKFIRADGTEGEFAFIRIADKSGTLKTFFWDEKVNLVKDGMIKRESIIKISHGYVRRGRDGQLELHVGLQGDIQISPKEVASEDYPLTNDFVQKIDEITMMYLSGQLLTYES